MIRAKKETLMMCLFLLGLALLFCWPVLTIDIGEDEGWLALEARRLLSGELPNLDFPCPYMGGTVFYNALWFLLLGQSIWALRVGLSLFFIVFIAAVFFLTRQMMSRYWAAGVTLFALAVTLPLYPYLGANWNALTFGMLAFLSLFKSLNASTQKSSRGWMLAAGALAMGAVWFKQTVGLHTLFALYIALLMHLVYPFFSTDKLSGEDASPQVRLAKPLLFAGCLAVPAYLLFIIKPHLSVSNILIFALPTLAVLTGTLRLFFVNPPTSARMNAFAQRLLLFIAGALCIFALILIPYLLKNGVGEFIQNSLLGRPSFFLNKFYQDYMLAIIPFATLIYALYTGGLILLLKRPIIGNVLLVIALGLLVSTGLWPYSNFKDGAMGAMYPQLPLVILALGLWFYHVQFKKLSAGQPVDSRDWFAVAVFVSGALTFVSVYPIFAYPYVGCNLVFLAVFLGYLAYRHFHEAARWMKAPVALFAVYWIIFGVAHMYRIDQRFDALLPWPHGGVRVREDYARKLAVLVDQIKTQSKRPDDLYIFTDRAPGLYFFSDHTSPSRYNNYFFSLTGNNMDLIAELEAHRVSLLMVEEPTNFLLSPNPAFTAYLRQNYRVFLHVNGWLFLKREWPDKPQ